MAAGEPSIELKRATRSFVTPTGAVLTAIVKDRAEIVVLPGPGRLLKALMDLFPGLGPAINRAAGAEETMRTVIEHRRAHPASHFQAAP